MALVRVIEAHPVLAGGGEIVNQTTGAQTTDLARAIADAAPGDVLSVRGVHEGNFTVDKPLTLRGGGSAVLDAGGAGTALTIAADGVTVEGLALTGSGRAGLAALRRPAGVLVEADQVSLTGLTVTGNDTGVAFVECRNCVISGSRIADNQSEGVKVMGGQEHRIASSTISGNDVGVAIGPCYGDYTEMPRPIPPRDNDPAAIQRYIEETQAMAAFEESASAASDITAAYCELPGNGSVGISVSSQSRRIALIGNVVIRTGRDRPPNAEALAEVRGYLTEALGGTDPGDSIGNLQGAGIAFTCGTEDNRVIENSSDDNLGPGLHMSSTNRTEVAANSFARNRTGAWLTDADDNVVRGNTIADNEKYGLIIDNLMMSGAPAPSGSTRNLITSNNLSGNAVNAYDSSDWVATRAEVQARMANAPWPPQVREQMLANPRLMEQTIAGQLERHSPGTNRWDDGALGNHYDDFDEDPEGFRDADGDGVGEVAHPIPGGGHVDRFPLTEARILRELGG